MESMLRDILAQVQAGIIYLDKRLYVVYANAAGKVFHGYAPNAVFVSKSIYDLLSDDIIQFVGPMLRDTLATGTPHSFLAHTDQDGNKVHVGHNFRETNYFRTSYTPKFNDRKEIVGVIVLLEDITQIKRAEFEIAEKNNNLEYLIRLLSHDFKEPARTISNISQLTARKYSEQLDQKGREYLNYMRTTSMHMVEMVQSLLKFIKLELEEHEMNATSANTLLQNVLASLQTSISEKNATVNVLDLPDFKGEPLLIRQVFQNLIENALKYTLPDTPPQIEIGGKQRGSKVEFYMQDNGIGISADFHDKVFEPFTRLAEQKSGSNLGMGLAFCKRIVHTHGGTIMLDSAPGEGTKISFTLPAA